MGGHVYLKYSNSLHWSVLGRVQAQKYLWSSSFDHKLVLTKSGASERKYCFLSTDLLVWGCNLSIEKD